MNRRGTEPYARWCGKTGDVSPPLTRFWGYGFTIAHFHVTLRELPLVIGLAGVCHPILSVHIPPVPFFLLGFIGLGMMGISYFDRFKHWCGKRRKGRNNGDKHHINPKSML
jgi:hypothetical protein